MIHFVGGLDCPREDPTSTTEDPSTTPDPMAPTTIAPDYACKHLGAGYWRSNFAGKYFYCLCSTDYGIWVKHLLQCPIANGIELEFEKDKNRCTNSTDTYNYENI